jgi:hypothetical protein
MKFDKLFEEYMDDDFIALPDDEDQEAWEIINNYMKNKYKGNFTNWEYPGGKVIVYLDDKIVVEIPKEEIVGLK